MNINFYRITLFIFVTSLLSCSHEPILLPDTPEVCFQEQVLPLINSNCAVPGCHSASSGGEEAPLTTYSEILNYVEPGKPNKSKLYETITANSILEESMPPKPRIKLSSYQVSLISIWILQGAPNNSCPDPPCDTLSVTYSTSILPVMDTYCKGCHSGGEPSGGISLETYDEIAVMAQNGRLYGSVSHDPAYKPMPFESSKLSDCIVTMFRIWVENGAPDN